MGEHPDQADEYVPCSTCGGDGSDLTPESNGENGQCPACEVWHIDFCPDCGDEYEEPCAMHLNTEHF